MKCQYIYTRYINSAKGIGIAILSQSVSQVQTWQRPCIVIRTAREQRCEYAREEMELRFVSLTLSPKCCFSSHFSSFFIVLLLFKSRFVAWSTGLPRTFADCVFVLINSVLLNFCVFGSNTESDTCRVSSCAWLTLFCNCNTRWCRRWW